MEKDGFKDLGDNPINDLSTLVDCSEGSAKSRWSLVTFRASFHYHFHNIRCHVISFEICYMVLRYVLGFTAMLAEETNWLLIYSSPFYRGGDYT